MRDTVIICGRETGLSCETTPSREPVYLITHSQNIVAIHIEIGPNMPRWAKKSNMAQMAFH